MRTKYILRCWSDEACICLCVYPQQLLQPRKGYFCTSSLEAFSQTVRLGIECSGMIIHVRQFDETASIPLRMGKPQILKDYAERKRVSVYVVDYAGKPLERSSLIIRIIQSKPERTETSFTKPAHVPVRGNGGYRQSSR